MLYAEQFVLYKAHSKSQMLAAINSRYHYSDNVSTQGCLKERGLQKNNLPPEVPM